MAEITVSMVKELRERTQAGMGDCKNALVESGGDLDKAVEIILKKGIVKAAARAGRVASEGEVRSWVAPDAKRGVLVEVNCQTDFVSRGEEFRGFVGKVLEVATKLPRGADLLAQKFPGMDKTIDAVRAEMVAKTGENTVVRRWDVLEAKEPTGFVHAYVHAGGKLAVLVHATAPNAEALKNAEFKNFADNVAMQACAMRPLVVKKDELAKTAIDKQREIFEAQMKEDPKQPPAAAVPKILEGKLAKWFTEVTLLGQDNVWEQGAGTVDKIRGELGKKLGGEVKIHAFVRYALGEGIDKGPQEDLAAEIGKIL
jgi:elongation factor Ts